jgi:orotidine-5'-phosphate decarboxylase
MKVLAELMEQIQSRGDLLTILDAKRGDIASTATAYAQAAFGGATVNGLSLPSWHADACTVNPYLGADAVEPFITAARAATPGRGLFVLVRTSNPGGGLFQNLPAPQEPLYCKVADELVQWNAPGVGECGLGDVGAVVGATNPVELAELRARMPQVWFLVPGYGAQGGTAADVRAGYRKDGLGAIVNSSRGVTFSFHPDDPNWQHAIIAAARKAQHELRP